MPVTLECTVCGATFSVCPYRAKTAKYCCYKCRQIGEGRKAGAVRAEQMRASSNRLGYKKVKCRHEHRAVVENLLGRKLKSNEVVHHKDGDKYNNAIWNLQLLTRREHIYIHLFPEKFYGENNAD
jgi:hypothetical protein